MEDKESTVTKEKHAKDPDNTEPNDPELKRVQSVKQMVKAYQQQRLTIKTALGDLNQKHNKKIYFDDEPKISDDNSKNTTASQKNGKRKPLFDSDDDDAGDFNIEVKNQFEGTEGRQLFELQSRYKGDSRFNLDDRFIENKSEETEKPAVASAELSLEDEKKTEFEILEQVLGKRIKSNKSQTQDVGSKRKSMLRYDPTQADHSKYQTVSVESPKKKKRKNKDVENEENLQTGENDKDPPSVSKDVFYKVTDGLKNTLETEQGFSLLNIFGNDKEVECEEEEEEEEEQAKPITKKNKLHVGSNPFRYDSTDDELDEAGDEQNNTKIPDEAVSSNPQPNTKFGFEPLFFKDDDFRLQEGSDFVKRIASETTSEFGQQRRNLRYIVKAKVRNNQKKKDPFRKKIGGGKRKKMLRVKKAMNR